MRWFISIRMRKTSQPPGVWFSAQQGGKGPAGAAAALGVGFWGAAVLLYVLEPSLFLPRRGEPPVPVVRVLGGWEVLLHLQTRPHHQHPPKLLPEAPHHVSGFCLPG